jgi:murein DD-endopeptidase MepM/ murein hydrolase activator NlpD
MTAGYFPQDEDWISGEWAYEEEAHGHEPAGGPFPFDVITLAAAILVILALVTGLSRLVLSRPAGTAVSAPTAETAPRSEEAIEERPVAPPVDLSGPEAFTMPYAQYVLTQGPHGMSYGHFAIDIAAGAGEPILSPINGRVTERFIDGIGNPTLVIENEAYTVTMLHGEYSVGVGEEVRIGEQVGVESNQGNTRDMAGNSCRNRNCGYHTHLNVYDKRAGGNINPLDLLS